MMLDYKEIIVIIVLFIILLIMVSYELQLAHKKKSEAAQRLNQKIIATLIRHGGKMNYGRIGIYLGLPDEAVAVCIAKMEKKGTIYRRANDDICLKG